MIKFLAAKYILSVNFISCMVYVKETDVGKVTEYALFLLLVCAWVYCPLFISSLASG